MQDTKGRNVFTGTLVFGAMVFGMVLAGGTHLTPVLNAAPETAIKGQPVSVPVAATGSLPSFADLAEAVSPAVVSIQRTKIEEVSDRRGNRDIFEFFSPRRQQPRGGQPRGGQPQERREDSAGSGFVISADGLVVTNHHVIEDATELIVLVDGREYVAEIKGDDPATDIALLKIEPDEELTFLDLGDSESLRVGDWVMVIGSPLNLQNSVSVGVVSAKNRSINITADRSLEAFIQTDAAINFGNSGGPLVDLAGRVIGIATAINYGANDIGFAVPVSTLQRILPQLRETGEVKRGYLGVLIEDLGYDDAAAWGVESGVLINEITEGGPAEDAGLEPGDIIVRVDQHKVEANRDLIDYVSALPPGEKVEVQVVRDGKTVDKSIELGERPLEGVVPEIAEPEQEENTIEWLGLQYQEMTPTLRENHNLPDELQGVIVVNVLPSSPLFEKGVQPGDVIVEVNRRDVRGIDDFERLVGEAESGSYLRLYVESLRRGRAFFVTVKVP